MRFKLPIHADASTIRVLGGTDTGALSKLFPVSKIRTFGCPKLRDTSRGFRPRGECLHGSKEDATDRSGGAGGIGHSSWLLAQRPSLGVMLNPYGEPVAGPRWAPQGLHLLAVVTSSVIETRQYLLFPDSNNQDEPQL